MSRYNTFKIALLTQVYQQAQDALGIARADLYAAKREVCGVKEGDVVTYKGADHMVSEIDVSWHDKPWVKGYPKKKDGTWGTGARSLYSYWEKS